ncbi:MAG: histidine--tRNA ligase [Lachnospiraceae bacterium]|nr:histidine--tRNA ligase [Lachnospiraceae bacterium]
MKTTPVKGTNDYLPEQVILRDYLQDVILKTYQSYGFTRISTPILEDAENLDKSEGGENLNLIFKILKRGDKLTKALNASQFDKLSDLGLRYDLTLPLSRYYACNRSKLIQPFKCIQMDKVYRAERPQKGRLREFIQCDIDILGSSSVNCEIELINTTTKALFNIGMKNIKVKINDRSLLNDILIKSGFNDEQLPSVCITLDKLDKVGIDGIKSELDAKEFDASSINSLISLLEKQPVTLDSVKELCGQDNEAIIRLEHIINSINSMSDNKYDIVYDITLVRGQGYYTGTVFEVESTEFKGAIAGGGRYDNLIGKFINESVPAVGFSIGFERIFSILTESGFDIPDYKKLVALIYDSDSFIEANLKADELRNEYNVVMYEKPRKNMGKFIDRLESGGCDGFFIFNQSESIKFFS